MADYSFDIVSKVDLNVIAEAVSAANKEITNRYDFKGTNSTLELNQKDNELKLLRALPNAAFRLKICNRRK